MGEPNEPERRAPVLAAALVCAALGAAGAWLVSDARSYGWDESMHTALPAARIALALRAGEAREAVDVVLGCNQYPFVYPLALGLLEAVVGVSEHAARALGRVVWAFGLLGVFLAARAAAGRALGAAEARIAPWVALALAAASPLAVAYSGTLFQETAFTALAAWATYAWLRRDGRARADLWAGLLLTLAFFTRFATGVLLGLALFLDLGVELALAARAGRSRQAVTGALRLAAIPAAAFAWWFVLPLPEGLALGAEHREAFLAFLAGNRGEEFRVPWSTRWLDWTLGFCAGPRAFLLTAGALLAALPIAARPGARTLWILFLAAGVPVWRHEFHLDRFLLHQGVAIHCLAGIGVARGATAAARALGRRRASAATPRAAPAIAAALLALALAFPGVDGRALGRAIVRPTPENAAYVDMALREKQDLSPARTLPTNGLARAEADRVLDLVAAAAGPEGRVAWLGINTELSPAALHLGLLARGGAPLRFRRDAARARPDGHPDLCVSFRDADPGWGAAAIAAWAEAFDVVITTRPPDFRASPARAWVRRYQDALLTSGGWRHEVLGTVEIARPGRVIPVEVFALRGP